MEEKLPILRQVDQYLFDKIDLMKKSQGYQNFQDTFQSLEEEQQKIAKMVATILIFALPALFIFFFWANNFSLQSDLDLRKKIVDRAQEIIKQQKRTESLTTSLLSSDVVDSQDTLNTVIISYLNGTGIDLSKFKINDFTTESVGTDLSRAQAKLNFESLNNDQLMNLFINLISRGKMKISSFKVTRNKETSLLNGEMQIIQFSQAVAEEE